MLDLDARGFSQAHELASAQASAVLPAGIWVGPAAGFSQPGSGALCFFAGGTMLVIALPGSSESDMTAEENHTMANAEQLGKPLMVLSKRGNGHS